MSTLYLSSDSFKGFVMLLLQFQVFVITSFHYLNEMGVNVMSHFWLIDYLLTTEHASSGNTTAAFDRISFLLNKWWFWRYTWKVIFLNALLGRSKDELKKISNIEVGVYNTPFVGECGSGGVDQVALKVVELLRDGLGILMQVRRTIKLLLAEEKKGEGRRDLSRSRF